MSVTKDNSDPDCYYSAIARTLPMVSSEKIFSTSKVAEESVTTSTNSVRGVVRMYLVPMTAKSQTLTPRVGKVEETAKVY